MRDRRAEGVPLVREPIEEAIAREQHEARVDARKPSAWRRAPLDPELLYRVRMLGRTDEGQLRVVRSGAVWYADGARKGDAA